VHFGESQLGGDRKKEEIKTVRRAVGKKIPWGGEATLGPSEGWVALQGQPRRQSRKAVKDNGGGRIFSEWAGPTGGETAGKAQQNMDVSRCGEWT